VSLRKVTEAGSLLHDVAELSWAVTPALQEPGPILFFILNCCRGSNTGVYAGLAMSKKVVTHVWLRDGMTRYKVQDSCVIKIIEPASYM
jgi:hypothetical protein